MVDGGGIFRRCRSQIIMMYHSKDIPWTNALIIIINLPVKLVITIGIFETRDAGFQ